MINNDLKKIKAIFFDVDGVLSQSTISLDIDGQPRRSVNIKDGYALQLAVKRGLIIAIITGAKVEEIAIRYQNLGIKEIYLGCKIKVEIFNNLMAKYQLNPEEVIYMGDDIPDYEIMKSVGFPCCPEDAVPEIKEISKFISKHKGGCGCAREIIEQVLKSQNLWLMDNIAFGW